MVVIRIYGNVSSHRPPLTLSMYTGLVHVTTLTEIFLAKGATLGGELATSQSILVFVGKPRLGLFLARVVNLGSEGVWWLTVRI